MLAVMTSCEEAEALIESAGLRDRISVAAVNAPELTVVSGPSPDIRKFEEVLATKNQTSGDCTPRMRSTPR